jgi:integrase
VLSAHELGRVLEVIDPEWRAAVLLLATTAMRWGELSALRWEDIDEERMLIRIERNNHAGVLTRSTKTGRARTVPLLPTVAQELYAHRERLRARGIASPWIFGTEKPSIVQRGPLKGTVRPVGSLHTGHPLIVPGKGALTLALKAAGIERRVTVHGLRHTANDLLRRVASAEVTRSITGHVTERMTLHYSHVDAAEKHQAATKLLALAAGERGDNWGGSRGSDEQGEEAVFEPAENPTT